MIKEILELQEQEVFSYVWDKLAVLYKEDETVTDGDNYLVFHGTNKIALVAHIDTLPRKAVAIKVKNNVMYNPNNILGADDRAGVYAMIECAIRCHHLHMEMPTLIFTNHEESGGIGVAQLCVDDVLMTKGINLFVEFDRKGCNEYVFYTPTLPKAVRKYVESYGYVEATGSYSDITDLTAEYSIPSVNVSCGYYLQHSNNERLHLDELEFNIARVMRMLEKPIQQLHEVESYSYKSGGYGHLYAKDDLWSDIKYGSYENERLGDSKGNLVEIANYYNRNKVKVVDVDANDPTGYEAFVGESIYDLKDIIKREILTEGLSDTGWDAIKDDHMDMLRDLEMEVRQMIYCNPDNPSDAFEVAWDEAVIRQLRRRGEIMW